MKLLDKNQIVKERMIENVMHERKILTKLSHPLIVNLRYSFQDEYNLFMIVDFMRGGDLRYHLRYEKKFITLERVKFYVAQVSLVLKYMHDLGYIHRDIKPDNLLIDGDGNCRVTDFNLSKHIKKGAKGMTGTKPYMAPEILKNQVYGKEVDWWSLGITAYELAFKTLPFDGNGDALIEEIINSKVKFPSDRDKKFASLIKGLLNKDPGQRFGYEEVKNHEFYKDFDWEKLEQNKLEAPWIPDPNKNNFDSVFDLDNQFEVKKKKVPLSPELDKEFEGWEWAYDKQM